VQNLDAILRSRTGRLTGAGRRVSLPIANPEQNERIRVLNDRQTSTASMGYPGASRSGQTRSWTRLSGRPAHGAGGSFSPHGATANKVGCSTNLSLLDVHRPH